MLETCLLSVPDYIHLKNVFSSSNIYIYMEAQLCDFLFFTIFDALFICVNHCFYVNKQTPKLNLSKLSFLGELSMIHIFAFCIAEYRDAIYCYIPIIHTSMEHIYYYLL